ncbi:MAG: hypothetical protein KAT70_09280, partial [Thermoplasmata archaeon]|nr:hypothetical protein [Thermoplasmata archaeon]
GIPVVTQIVSQLQKSGDPSVEDILAIEDMLKDPESYFEPQNAENPADPEAAENAEDPGGEDTSES